MSSPEQKAVGVWIRVWVPVGRGQQQQNRIPGVQDAIANGALPGHEAPSVLYWRVEARNLCNQLVNLCRSAGYLLEQPGLLLKCNKRVADQSGGCFASLG